ncbi:class I SAM-dependent methyltransferase [Sulfurifustis variabilis]|uniref:class I SAM-dependent methyltransferase n=1 Tax=Sulfurifustis variabilis TaxID=1675686 RepID=UPI0018D594D3|nr:SAM-dependent methyltransferase [Sulfurifustis variabilis]
MADRIRAEIAGAGGAIGFDRFMELALYSPGFGYYSAPTERFGESGDFVTAPEISPLFGRCLAHPVAEVLNHLKGGDVLEAGAGSGNLAADLLSQLAATGALPGRYLILEVSGELRARQEATLRERVPEILPHVAWLDRLPGPGFRGVVLANELIDALPVVRFIAGADGAGELHVGVEGSRFAWREAPARAAVAERVDGLDLPAGYVSEVNLAGEGWVRSLAERLEQGLILLIDYGFPRSEYYHPERATGTLVCHYRHRVHDDPLVLVGLQDITAHVDFTAIAEAGRAAGLSVVGYTSQAAFLLGSGLDRLLADSDPNDVRAHLALTQQVKKLTLPSEMGELFKVIGLARGPVPALAGFAMQDRRSRL